MKKTYAAFVVRSEKWDQSKPPQEQPGFDGHAGFVAGLEADGVVAQAGLMMDSTDVLFILFGDSKQEIIDRFSQDPWQQSGFVTLVRVEEVQFRIGAPQPPAK